MSVAYTSWQMVTNETKLWHNRMVQTMGMTYANGLGLTILINDPVDARSTLAGILAEQKRNLAAMVAANSPSATARHVNVAGLAAELVLEPRLRRPAPS